MCLDIFFPGDPWLAYHFFSFAAFLFLIYLPGVSGLKH